MLHVNQFSKEGMNYYVYRPSAPLNYYVDHFMVAQGYPEFQHERLFPNNEIELFINLGDTNRGKIFGNRDNFEFSRSILSGLRSSYLEIQPGRFFFIAGIRFSLFGFYHLFQIPTTQLCNENLPAEDVLGKEINELRHLLGDHHCPFQIIAKLEGWIHTKIRQPQLASMWSKVDAVLQNPQFRIREDLSDFLGYSYKHSLHLISKMCGLPPKMIQRIYRLKNLFGLQNEIENKSWAALTYQFGFADQSHFIKELKLFTGYTPSELIAIQPKDFLLKAVR